MNIEEVRLANQRLQAYIKGVNDGVDDRELEVSIYGEQCLDIATELQCDEALLLTWANDELARRESERVERAKPIDAEWCVANGAVNVDGCNMFRWMLKVVRVDWDEHNGTTIDGTDFNWVFLPSIKTRGQLLDLLAALKGGES